MAITVIINNANAVIDTALLTGCRSDGYSYNFNGTLLSSAGTYYDTLTAVNSLVSSHLICH